MENIEINLGQNLIELELPGGARGLKGEVGSQGPQGPIGPQGEDGYTPIKGVDYFTPEDIASISTFFIVSENSSDNPFVLFGKKAGIYFFDKSPQFSTSQIYVKFSESNNDEEIVYAMGGFFIIPKDITSDRDTYEKILFYIDATTGASKYMIRNSLVASGVALGKLDYQIEESYVMKQYDQVLANKLTFSTYLPESSIIPTSDNQLVNKVYVDDLVGDIETILTTLDIGSGV